MRIVSILTSYTAGGAEMLVSNLSGTFVVSGHRSIVVALSTASAIGNDPDMERTMRARIEDEGGDTHILQVRSRRNIVAGALALRRFVSAAQPDVIHAHTARAVAMLWLAGIRCPVVLTHHNSELSFPPILFRLFDRIVRRYVAISHDCAALLAAHTRRPIAAIVNAAGAGFLASAPRRALADRPTLLAVGALTAQKNYPMLIDAAARLRQMLGDERPFRLQIAGGGALLPELAARVIDRGVTGQVELLGSRTDVVDLMRRADIFVNASHYEGMPIAMLEAMQSALPIVATDVAGTRELVRDGHNGALVTSDDAEAMARGLAKLLSQPDDYGALSAAALDEGRRYGLDACARAHLALYDEVIAETPAIDTRSDKAWRDLAGGAPRTPSHAPGQRG